MSEADPEQPEPDEFGADLLRRLESTEGLLRAHKFAHAQAVRDAQEDGDEPAADSLAKIVKLELQTASLRMFIQARELTREP